MDSPPSKDNNSMSMELFSFILDLNSRDGIIVFDNHCLIKHHNTTAIKFIPSLNESLGKNINQVQLYPLSKDDQEFSTIGFKCIKEQRSIHQQFLDSTKRKFSIKFHPFHNWIVCIFYLAEVIDDIQHQVRRLSCKKLTILKQFPTFGALLRTI